MGVTRSTTASDTLGQLLRGEWPDPDGGPPISVPALVVAIECSLAGREAELALPLRLGRRIAVVSDATTRQVLGERVERALARIAAIVPVVLDAQPHADTQTVEVLRRASAHADALVAVGSGTINDVCKYAAAKDGKPYAVFATAPSMNGYASKNAAITIDGHKRSLPAASPVGVFMDLAVLCAAPARMIRAGLGDSLCRSTAQADWLLSHHLLGTPYRHAPFALLAEDEPALLDNPEALLHGDLDAMRALARTLILSGLGMTICDGSYPASQGEHLISHYIDMFAPAGRGACFHGEQVAVATLTMARIQEEVLAGGTPPDHGAAQATADPAGTPCAIAGAAPARGNRPNRDARQGVRRDDRDCAARSGRIGTRRRTQANVWRRGEPFADRRAGHRYPQPRARGRAGADRCRGGEDRGTGRRIDGRLRIDHQPFCQRAGRKQPAFDCRHDFPARRTCALRERALPADPVPRRLRAARRGHLQRGYARVHPEVQGEQGVYRRRRAHVGGRDGRGFSGLFGQ